ncbi:MAG: phosphate acyltransferase, partial [candidate division NC10 bacterium]
MRLERVVDLVELAGKMKASTVAVVGGYRNDDLRLVESARDHGIVDRILLVGPRKRIDQAIAEVGISIDPADIVPADDDVQAARATVQLIQAGGLDIVLKGGISTPVINRHMIPLAVRPTVSLATVFDSPCIANGRPILLTDAGVTTVCNFGRLADMIHNAVDVARTVMGIDRPRVAVLSANEKQIPSLPSTWMGLELAKRTWPHAVVCGPLSFDLAIDPESVSIKGMPDVPNAAEVAGQADVLICPGIDTANALYKLISALNKYGEASLASITMGFPVPYIILSRADSLETRLVSIALCAVYSQRKAQMRPAAPVTAVQPAAAEAVAELPSGQAQPPAQEPAANPPPPCAPSLLAAARQAGQE